MRFNIRMVSKNPLDFAKALGEIRDQIVRKNIPSNCCGDYGENAVFVDFEFTDCDDVYYDDSGCKVIKPFARL